MLACLIQVKMSEFAGGDIIEEYSDSYLSGKSFYNIESLLGEYISTTSTNATS